MSAGVWTLRRLETELAVRPDVSGARPQDGLVHAPERVSWAMFLQGLQRTDWVKVSQHPLKVAAAAFLFGWDSLSSTDDDKPHNPPVNTMGKHGASATNGSCVQLLQFNTQARNSGR